LETISFAYGALLVAGVLGTGVVAGILAGLLGVGGGIVIVTVLFWMLDLLNFPDSTAMHMAVGTSLATIVPTSISSMRAHAKKGALDRDLLKHWGIFIVAGALIGGFTAKFVSGDVLRLVFGVVALAVAANMLTKKSLVIAAELPKALPTNGAIASVIGFFSSWMGIGGGTLAVPTLSAFSFPIHKAVGTASAFGLLISIPAVIGFIASGYGVADRPPFSLGYVNLIAAGLIFPVTVLCAPLGVKFAHALNQQALKRAFAVFLLITALRMLWASLS